MDRAFRLANRLIFTCPACCVTHQIPVEDPEPPLKEPVWKWNGSLKYPTLTPSIKVTNGDNICHSFVNAGKIAFCADSTHSLANLVVDLPDICMKY